MRPNQQETADLVTFTGGILNGKLHSLCSVNNYCEACSYRIVSYETSLVFYIVSKQKNLQIFFYIKV